MTLHCKSIGRTVYLLQVYIIQKWTLHRKSTATCSSLVEQYCFSVSFIATSASKEMRANKRDKDCQVQVNDDMDGTTVPHHRKSPGLLPVLAFICFEPAKRKNTATKLDAYMKDRLTQAPYMSESFNHYCLI